MMKVGILTIYGGISNYGNTLQNYALQSALRKNGIDSETIRYNPLIIEVKKNPVKKIGRIYNLYFKNGFKEGMYNCKKIGLAKIHADVIKEKKREREKRFREFESKYMNFTKAEYESVASLMEKCQDYDYVIAGSDQVWNPFGYGKFEEFFLTFVPREKRVAYAPSIAVPYIPDAQKEQYRCLLEGFDKLSCREAAGAQIIKELVNKECEHVCDPVFLLSDEEWAKFARPINTNYIATYFLGGATFEQINYINKYAKEHNCEVVDLWSPKDYKSLYVDVEDFISYIANAKVFFTDSFHGCAFAIIFKKQFVVCERRTVSIGETMYSRIDSLMDMLNVKGCKYDEFIRGNREIDYTLVGGYLENWRNKSIEYLSTCLQCDIQ